LASKCDLGVGLKNLIPNFQQSLSTKFELNIWHVKLAFKFLLWKSDLTLIFFYFRCSYQTHCRIHNDLGNLYVCPDCGENFDKNISEFKKHIKLHCFHTSRIQGYRCPVSISILWLHFMCFFFQNIYREFRLIGNCDKKRLIDNIEKYRLIGNWIRRNFL